MVSVRYSFLQESRSGTTTRECAQPAVNLHKRERAQPKRKRHLVGAGRRSHFSSEENSPHKTSLRGRGCRRPLRQYLAAQSTSNAPRTIDITTRAGKKHGKLRTTAVSDNRKSRQAHANTNGLVFVRHVKMRKFYCYQLMEEAASKSGIADGHQRRSTDVRPALPESCTRTNQSGEQHRKTNYSGKEAHNAGEEGGRGEEITNSTSTSSSKSSTPD